MRLKSRLSACVDGFRYIQKETGWKSWEADPVTLWDFNGLCVAIQKHRQANPRFKLSTDFVTIQAEVDLVNAQRMTTIPGADIYVIDSQIGGQPAETKKVPEAAPTVAAKAKLLNAGHSLIQEWKREGYDVVPSDESSRRADICSRCPKNGSGGLERYFTLPMSALIKRDMEELQGRKLTTPSDEKLGICSACLCPLKVKVHCALPLIQKHLQPEAKAELWSECWILE